MPATPIYQLPYPAAADPADVPIDMQELADRIEVVLPSLITPEAWHEVGAASQPAFLNSWVNFGGTFATAAFYKDAQGIVWLKGCVKNGTSQSTVFTLPAGYRPAAQRLWPTVAAGAFAQVTVMADGQVQMGTPGVNASLFLDVISFRAA